MIVPRVSRSAIQLSLLIVASAVWIPLSRTPANAALVCALTLLAMVNYALKADILYPAFVFCVVWDLAATVSVVSPVDIDPLSWRAFTIFAGGALCLSLGCALGDRALNKYGRAAFTSETRNSQPRRILLLYSLVMLLLFARDTARLGGGFSFSPQFFIAARDAIVDAATYGESVYSSRILSTAPMISILTAWIMLMEEPRKSLKAVAVVIAVIMGILSTGRVMLLQFFCGWMVIKLLKRPDRSLHAMGPIAISLTLALLVVMTGLTLLTKRDTQTDDALRVATNLTAVYLSGPLAAFDYGTFHPAEVQSTSVIEPIVLVPLPVNVYTMYKPYYLRFGMAGCFLVMLLAGLIHGGLFHASSENNHVAAFFMAYLYFALTISLLSDTYGLWVRHLEVVIFAVLYFGFIRKAPHIAITKNRPRFVLSK